MTKLDPSTVKTLEAMLYGVWRHNNQTMLDAKEGRPFADKDSKDIDGDGNREEYLTVSETIGYKLFREVLMGIHARKKGERKIEEETARVFASVFDWADKNLRRDHVKTVYAIDEKKWVEVPENKRDSLLAWRWAPTIDGKRGGIIRFHQFREPDHTWIDGLDGAPDGDLFTIAALYMASNLWKGVPKAADYRRTAGEMAHDARIKYVREIGGQPYLLGGDEFFYVNGINPSYGFEAIYDLLGDLDPSGKDTWQKLKHTSMQAAVAGADSIFHKSDGTIVRGKVNVPPNWLSFDGKKYTDMPWFEDKDWFMGWDGIRTLWLKSAYYLYDQNKSARRYLTDHTGTKKDFGPYAFLRKQYERRGFLQLGYGIDGTEQDPTMVADDVTRESSCSNGIYLGYFYAAGDKKMTMAMIDRLKSAYEPMEGTFADGGTVKPDNYFPDHWAWFGMAMALGLVENFFDIYKSHRDKTSRQGVSSLF